MPFYGYAWGHNGGGEANWITHCPDCPACSPTWSDPRPPFCDQGSCFNLKRQFKYLKVSSSFTLSVTYVGQRIWLGRYPNSGTFMCKSIFISSDSFLSFQVKFWIEGVLLLIVGSLGFLGNLLTLAVLAREESFTQITITVCSTFMVSLQVQYVSEPICTIPL